MTMTRPVGVEKEIPRLWRRGKTIRKVTPFTLEMAMETLTMLILAVSSKYGTAAPLILFGIPMGIVPLV